MTWADEGWKVLIYRLEIHGLKTLPAFLHHFTPECSVLQWPWMSPYQLITFMHAWSAWSEVNVITNWLSHTVRCVALLCLTKYANLYITAVECSCLGNQITTISKMNSIDFQQAMTFNSKATCISLHIYSNSNWDKCLEREHAGYCVMLLLQ